MNKLKLIIFSLLLFQLSYLQASNSHIPHGYLIAQIEVKDRQAYMQEYASRAIATIMQSGAEVLVAQWDKKPVEGKWPSNLTVVIQFPSLEIAQQWYQSKEYQKARVFRLKNAKFSNMIFVEQFIAPTQ